MYEFILDNPYMLGLLLFNCRWYNVHFSLYRLRHQNPSVWFIIFTRLASCHLASCFSPIDGYPRVVVRSTHFKSRTLRVRNLIPPWVDLNNGPFLSYLLSCLCVKMSLCGNHSRWYQHEVKNPGRGEHIAWGQN